MSAAAPIVKVLVAGACGVGKSSLITRFCDNAFEDIHTPGKEHLGHALQTIHVESDNTVTTLHLTEHCPTCAEREHVVGIGARYRDAAALILMYDAAVPFAESHRHLRILMKEADTFAGSPDRVPRVLVANKCDRGAAENDQVRTQLEQARAWAQRCGLAFLECSARAPFNVDALFVLVTTYLHQIATLPRSTPRWFAPRWGRTTAGKWLAERRQVGSFVVYPWFWRRKQAQHDAACSHAGSAGFELAEIVVGNGELFVQHKSISVTRVLAPPGVVLPQLPPYDANRRPPPLVLRFVLAVAKRGFPTLTSLVLCHKSIKLDAYRLQPLAVAPPDPKDHYAAAAAAASGANSPGAGTLSRLKKTLLSRTSARSRSNSDIVVDAQPPAAAAAVAVADGGAADADQPALLEGELRVQTQTVSKKSDWKRRYVSVLRDRVCVYASERDRTRRAAPSETIKLESCSVALVTTTERQQLELTLPGAPSKRVFRPSADTGGSLQNWHEVLRRAIQALAPWDVDTPMPEPDKKKVNNDDDEASGDDKANDVSTKDKAASFFDLPASQRDEPADLLVQMQQVVENTVVLVSSDDEEEEEEEEDEDDDTSTASRRSDNDAAFSDALADDEPKPNAVPENDDYQVLSAVRETASDDEAVQVDDSSEELEEEDEEEEDDEDDDDQGKAVVSPAPVVAHRNSSPLNAEHLRAARFLTSAGYGAEPALRALQQADGNVEQAVQILVQWAIEGQVVGKAEPQVAAASSSPPPPPQQQQPIVSPLSNGDDGDDDDGEANKLAAEQAATLAAKEAVIKQTYAARKAALLENAKQTNLPLSDFVRQLEYEAQQVAFALARQRYQIESEQLRAANERQRANIKRLLIVTAKQASSTQQQQQQQQQQPQAPAPAAVAAPVVKETLAAAAQRFSLPIVSAEQIVVAEGATTVAHGSRTLSDATWRDVAVLVVAPSDAAIKADRGATMKALERETVLLCRLRHPHVAALVAVRAGGAPGIVLMHSRASTLETALASGALTTLLQRLRVARCVARALVYLHYVCKPAIVHRGVRPAAILCTAGAAHDAKLAGFECAQPVGGDAVPWALTDEVPRWTAPELLAETAYDARVDVYSFGVVLWQLLANRVPFADADSLRAVRARVQDGMRPDTSLMIDKSEAAAAAAAAVRTSSVSGTAALAGLVARAWSALPDQRPTMADAAKMLSTVCAGVERKDAQQEEDRQMCSVCLDQPRCVAFVPCGHVATCENCSHDLRGHPCVICFLPSSSSIKIFL